MPHFEWDAAKADNRLKHGISFDDAAQALLGLGISQQSMRGDENRFVSICECDGRTIVVIWTPRDGALRIISARAARKNERTQYDQAIGRSAANR